MRAVDPRLLRRARSVRVLLGIDVALGLATALLVLAQASLLADVISRGFAGQSVRGVSGLLVLLVVVFAGRAVLGWGFEVAGRDAASAVLSDLRLALVEQRLRRQPAGLDGVEGAEVATAAVQGVDGLAAYFGRYLPQLVLACLVPVAVLVRTATVDVESALIMLATLPLVPVFMWLIGRQTERRTRERWDALQRLSSHFMDVIRGLPTLRAFNRGRAQSATIADVGERYRRTTMATLRLSFLSGSVLELAATISVALVAVTVGVRLVDGGLGLNAGLTVLILAPELYLPLRQLGSQFHASADGLAAAERILELLDAPAETGEGGTRVPPDPGVEPVRVEGVSFAYPSRPGLVLDGFDLTLAPGETVALTGASGAGKSTVAALLLRFAEPAAGRITAGGVDLADCSTAEWRRSIAWVPQRPTIFRGTVADNIRLGGPGASEELVRRAAVMAGADDVVASLPDGYATVVGDGGRPLSMGECRRIALARVFLRRAPLVILDEPTADLDPDSAECVANAIERLGRGATVLLITHNPRLMDRADRTVALADGRAVAGARSRRRVIAEVRSLMQIAPASRTRVALVVALGAATVLCGVGLMATAGYLISRASERPAILSLTVAIVLVRAFGIARPLFRYLERLASHDLAFRALAGARVRAYERLEPLAPAQLEGYRDGDLLSRMVADVDSLQDLHLRGLDPPLVALAAGTVSVVAAAFVLPASAAVLAVGLVAAAIAAPAVAVATGRRDGRSQAPARGELTAEMVELLHGGAELVAYGCEAPRLERVRDCDRRLVRLARTAALGDGAGDALRLAITGLTVAGVLATAIAAHASGHLDGPMIALLGLLALASFEAVQPLPQAARALGETLAAGRRLLEVTSRRPRVSDPVDPAMLPAGPLEVALEHVRVRLAPGEPVVLDDVSLRLEPGQRVALLGPSGVGKSTIANLLLRFVDPEEGRVTLAGRDLRAYRQEDVRRAIAVVSQDTYLFSTSIIENVRLARPEASDDEVMTALRRTGIGDWVEGLPAKGATLVGENGRELSGGQRQRVGVARALLSDARVLVFDEPTAHLDPPGAEALVSELVAVAGERSVLLITHRPEGLEHMDAIVRLG